MTELIIFTAGRDDAYADYRRSVVQGESYETLADHLEEPLLTKLHEVHSERVPLWCTQQDQYWRRIQEGDVAVFYHDKHLVGRATVLAKSIDLSLAKHLWRAPGTTWSNADPWKYLLFEDFREMDVPIEEFNRVFGYKQAFVPRGVMCVKEETVSALNQLYGDVTAALNALVAETATEGVPVQPDGSKAGRKRSPVKGNPDKGKALQEMYRKMIDSDS